MVRSTTATKRKPQDGPQIGIACRDLNSYSVVSAGLFFILGQGCWRWRQGKICASMFSDGFSGGFALDVQNFHPWPLPRDDFTISDGPRARGKRKAPASHMIAGPVL